jgi:eukaryotic-like serine/threonine-protein kinase
VGRFVGEVRIIGRLEHPNIVPIHDVGQDVDGSYYFVMKYVEGDSLEQVIERLDRGDPETRRAWPFERRVEVVKAVLRALAAAHAQGIVHRDVKPANVMVGRFGEVFLTDWGIARSVGAPEEAVEDSVPSGRVGGSTRAGALIGTLSCMSPEQLRGEHAQLDARSDLYAVGLLLHELLTLRHPWRGEEDPAKIAEIQRHLKLSGLIALKSHPHQSLPPVEYLYFCGDLCTFAVEDRVPSAAVAIQMIEALERGEVPVRCHVTFTKRMTRESGHWVERYPNVTFLVMVLGAASAMIGVAAMVGVI